MYHPLLENLDDKSIDQLTTMQNDLSKKMSIAYRSGNYELLEQIRLVYDAVQDKVNEKNRKQMQAIEQRQNKRDSGDPLDIG